MMSHIVFYYVLGIIQEYIHYWYVYLLLSLPPRMFNIFGNEIILQPDDSSDSDESTQKNDQRTCWMLMIKLILTNGPNQYESEIISGAQLMLLADSQGRIPINQLQTYYPNLDTLYIQYLDLTQQSVYYNLDKEATKYSGLSFVPITKVIDINKRKDIRSGKKCKFGQIHI